MITAKTFDEFEITLKKGLEKASNLFPEYRKVEGEEGLWEVQSSDGKRWYQVRVGQKLDGEHFIACVCRGGLERHGCYHAAVIFRIEQRHRKEKVDSQESPYLKQETGKKTDKIGNIRF